METYNLGTITKSLYDSGAVLFSQSAIRDTIHTSIKPATLAVLIRRLIEIGVLIKLERNKYLVNKTGTHDFLIANFLYEPSYVSFESALNFHGVLPQFPYEITSATTKKPTEKTTGERTYRFSHIKKTLFWGYDKSNGFLLADPEKALLDTLYLAAKRQRVVYPDDLVMERISVVRFRRYADLYPKTKLFRTFLKELPL